MKITGRYLAGPVVLAAVALTGCGGSSSSSSPAAATSASVAVPARPAGCDQAGHVLNDVMQHVTFGDITAAQTQLRAFAATLPSGSGLSLQISQALVDLGNYKLDQDQGKPTGRDSDTFTQQVAAINRYCGT